jgi:hypothetical protein
MLHPCELLSNPCEPIKISHNFTGKLYTQYEKLTLPFDFTTWILLWLTFAIAFIVIFIINMLPLEFQDVFYGEGVRMPAFNVVGTFFGIGQTRLPHSNFPRILLMLFIWFCLIFRTAHQSMMFEFMTSNPRRPAPRNISECVTKYEYLYASHYDYLQAKAVKVHGELLSQV